MSFETLQEHAALLDPEQRRQLIAYLVSLNAVQETDRRARLRAKMDDKNPERWVTLEEFDRRLGLDAKSG